MNLNAFKTLFCANNSSEVFAFVYIFTACIFGYFILSISFNFFVISLKIKYNWLLPEIGGPQNVKLSNLDNAEKIWYTLCSKFWLLNLNVANSSFIAFDIFSSGILYSGFKSPS